MSEEDVKSAGALAMFMKAGQLAKPGALASALSETLDEETSAGGGDFVFINMSGKTGRVGMGQNNDPIPDDMQFMVDGRMMQRGWICWKKGKPVGKVRWSIFDKATAEADLPDHGPYNEKAGEGWKSELIIRMIGDDGRQYEYSTSAVSAKNAMRDGFLQEMEDRDRMGEPSLALISILDMDTFEAQGQVNYKPVFKTHGWMTDEEAAAWIEGDTPDRSEPEPEPEPEPVSRPRRRRRAA